MKFFLYGAFDRHNYGDLLFPMVMERLIKGVYPTTEVFTCGLVESNLTDVGALETISAKSMMAEMDENSVLMLAGGDVIGCDWVSAYSYLLSESMSRVVESYIARFFPSLTRAFICSRMGLKSPFPFTVPKSLLPAGSSVVYNSAGATSLSSLSDAELQQVGEALKDADFLSVRDEFSKSLTVKATSPETQVMLAPDSVCMLSTVYDDTAIDERVSDSVKQLVDRLNHGKGYYIFQVSGPRAVKNQQAFAKALDSLFERTGVPVVFLAIGNAAGHEDSVGIASVKALLSEKTECAVYDEGNVYDTIYLLKHAACYMGTSLHGVITSIAYNTPRVGILTVRKQINYMNAWDLEGMPRDVAPANIPDAVEKAVSFSEEQLMAVRNQCVSVYQEHFSIMADKLGLGAPDFSLFNRS
ncbi:polysaccharide pyruvyl transferase family protein [Alteromonas sp. CYL-A6]|uniref:polysaccharide pyruvyl transferase family protein n=1 Tax=Alteromonas nitratireducens TaxID=3390813 RepID=UPI0034BCBC18